MKTIKTFGAVGSALAISGVLAFSGQVAAGQVTANLTSVSPEQNRGGLFRFDGATAPGYFNTFGTDQFVSFCIDRDDNIPIGKETTWSIVSLSEVPDPPANNMGDIRATQMSQLLGKQIGTDLNDARKLRDNTLKAIQLSLWEIIYETSADPARYSISDGDHTIGSDAGPNIVSLTDSMFSQLDGYTGLTMDGLVGLTNPDRQDMVGQVVPIPAAAWLFGSAMVGAVALGRRKKKAQAAA